VYALAIFDIGARMNANEITKFYPQVVASYFVHLDASFLDVVRTQAYENRISPLFATEENTRN
jgi:hypothetical protein